MDENKRESTPQEQEIDIMERYIEAQGPEQLSVRVPAQGPALPRSDLLCSRLSPAK